MRLASNGFWLMVPVLILNLVVAGKLPTPLSPEAFWNEIPAWIAWPENTSRFLVIAVPLAMRIEVGTGRARRGFLLFAAGVALYASSLTLLAFAPTSAWSESTLGLMMPALLPAIWLTGMALILRPIPALPLPSWLFGTIALMFLCFHQTHATMMLVWR